MLYLIAAAIFAGAGVGALCYAESLDYDCDASKIPKKEERIKSAALFGVGTTSLILTFICAIAGIVSFTHV